MTGVRDPKGRLCGSVSPVWTEETIATLRLMHAAGNSATQIGVALGCSRNAAIGKLHRLGLKDTNRPVHLRNGMEPGKPMRIPYNGKRPKTSIVRVMLGGHGSPRKVRPVPKPTPVAIVPVLGPVLNHLRPNSRCSFIADDPMLVPAAELLACGETVKAGSSFCPEHHARCFTRQVTLARAA